MASVAVQTSAVGVAYLAITQECPVACHS